MPHRLLALVLTLGLTVLVAGCGSDSNNSSSSSTTPSPSSSSSGSSLVCDNLDQLATDVKSMQDDNTVAEFQASLAAVNKDFDNVKAAAQAAYSGDIKDIETALNAFSDQLKKIGNGQGAMTQLEALGTAAGNVSDAVAALIADVPCPSSSSS